MAEHPNPQPKLSHRNGDAQELPMAPGPLESPGDAEAMATQALQQVQEAADRLKQATTQRAVEGMTTPELDGPVVTSNGKADLSMLSDVQLAMTVELGRTRMYVEDVLNLQAGAVVELDKVAGEPVDILVNGCPVARGEVLVLDDNFCIRVSEILTNGAQPPGDSSVT